MDFKSRLNEFLNYKGLTHYAFERRVGIGNGLSAKMTENTRMSTLKKIADAFPDLDINWLRTGVGNMLKTCNNVCATNQSVANTGNNVNVVIGAHGGELNRFGDSSERNKNDNWRPVLPSNIAHRPDYDIHDELLTNDFSNSNLEKLYSGNLVVDFWYVIEDNDLYPHFQRGDFIALRAYDRGDYRIKPGAVYAVDTIRDGIMVRRFKENDNGDFVSYTFNTDDNQLFVIPKDEVIRIYKIVLMFRRV